LRIGKEIKFGQNQFRNDITIRKPVLSGIKVNRPIDIQNGSRLI